MNRNFYALGYVLISHGFIFGWVYHCKLTGDLFIKIWFWIGIIVAMIVVAIAMVLTAYTLYDSKIPEEPKIKDPSGYKRDDNHGEYGD
jgi:glucan phosphoethanolaminetransferase (alkaline phosphatase superfamily)